MGEVAVMRKSTSAELGFTLIETSVVILIISMLLACIAVGGSLIQEAKTRAIISDFADISTGYKAFKVRYDSVPGDMINATSYWPNGTCAVTTSDCDGNGNAIIDTQYESMATWRHLSLAGMANYGLEPFSSNTTIMLIIGTDIPASRVEGGGYMMVSGDTTLLGIDAAIKSSLWNDGTNAVFIGRQILPNSVYLNRGALTGLQAFNIDQKADDAHISSSGTFLGADTGNIRTFEENELIGPNSTPNKCLSAAAPFTYVVNNVNTSCGVGMALK